MKKFQFAFLMVAMVFVLATDAQNTFTTTGQKVIVDNDKIKVTEYNGMPDKDVCGIGKHDHPAHLTIVLSDASVKITTAEGKVVEQKVPAGTTFWSDAETHTVVNSGKGVAHLYIIEPK